NYFSTKRGVYHYLSMAEGNYREYLKDEMVRAKKYFYVLRPILACRWIIDKGTPPPMLFSELMEAELPKALRPDIDRLLDLKINSPELKMIPRIDRINGYLDASIEEIKAVLTETAEAVPVEWTRLNELFRKYAV
ncbi:MAG: nucleotidyltransferase domain-containing protein, partial [Lachnospiraceae bacterium]|nr:nucleotidyltransferase domain-containing protein [Lachnospiraceae bacterium]